MAVNLACVPIIYLLYPETKNLPLEDMDALFGGEGASRFGRAGPYGRGGLARGDEEVAGDDTVGLGAGVVEGDGEEATGDGKGKGFGRPVVLEDGR